MWPSWNFPDFTPSVLNELDRETNVQHLFDATVVSGVETNQEKSLFGLDEKQYSMLRKLLRVSVYILRFIQKKIWRKVRKEKFLQQYKLLRGILENMKKFCFVSA